MRAAVFASLFLVGLTFGAYYDCVYYNSSICIDDYACFLDNDVCRANCTRIFFRVWQSDICEQATGCVTEPDDKYDEREQPCSFGDITDMPTISPTTSMPSTPMPTSSEPTTASPTASTDVDDTPQPTATTTTSEPTATSELTTSTTTDAPTTSLPPTRDSSGGNGRCKADGTIQEQIFGPGEYQCGDYNLGQPEETCIYIDASSTCSGTEFEDCGSESDPWPTFQSALDALDGRTVVIIVKAGTYTGEGNINIVSPNINSLNEYVYLNIFSESGSDDTVIDCQGEGFGFHWYQTTIRMDGFTVINCVAPERRNFSLPSYARNDYIANAPDSGRLGGAFFLDRTFITMNDMIIVNNGAEFGGGIFQYQNSIRMNNSIVEYNCATNSGGGIFLLFANIYIWNSYVSCNDADVFGGGIFGHQQRTDINEFATVDDNTARYADELFCDQTTVNVDSESNGLVGDNDVDNWEYNAETYCCCNNCAFYNLDRSIDFCSRSDNSLVDVSDLATLANDQGSCTVEISTTTTNTPGSTTSNTPGSTTSSTTSKFPLSKANDKVLAVTFVTMVISFIILM